MTHKRLIEEYIPIKAISAEASREKSIRHGHISTLHLWWARRPLVASRAAVFAALVPANAQPQLIDFETSQPYTITKFMIALCKWEVRAEVLDEARRLIREAYPDAPPKVLDMFAGGGSIPLEALRLGCEAYALDLNPVAHIIELATLVYPQKYGAQLAEDVKRWGEWVLERVRAEVGDLYPLIPDPEFADSALTPPSTERGAKLVRSRKPKQMKMSLFDDPEQLEMPLDADSPLSASGEGGQGGEGDLDDDTAPGDIPPGYLQPVAYLWTRTVTCPNPACRATVPLVRQTWLKKKKNDNVALEMRPHPTENRMAFYVKHARDEQGFGFDPAGFSQRGNSVCGRCGTTVTSDTVKAEGKAGRMGAQMMATVCVRPGTRGKVYLSPDEHDLPVPDDAAIRARIEALTAETGITPPDEEIETNPRSMDNEVYGFTRWSSLFTERQLLALLTVAKHIREMYAHAIELGLDQSYAKAIATYLAFALDKATDRNSSLCRWDTRMGTLASTFARQSIPMVWDYAEANPVGGGGGGIGIALGSIGRVISNAPTGYLASVTRGSATTQPFLDGTFDAVITDPPYYDNVSYSNLADYFYVWLKRSIGGLYPEHLGGDLTPKKNEAIVARYRHKTGDEARAFYENMMYRAFEEANRVLHPDSIMVTVYAHKTTAGWSTLIDAMRNAGFSMTEAWPVDTEMQSRAVARDTAALASSFFLVARKRAESGTGDYAREVLPEMQRIVRERVAFFLQAGITGADLNIAAVGAGLAPFTRYARVELPNGEELSAAAYLDEVQAEVVRALLGEAAKTDSATQYYIMGRAYYGETWVEFDEANTLARATGVELNTGAEALARGKTGLVEIKGSKARLRDYDERGSDDSLGLPSADRSRAPLIDVLHRLLWLVENDNGAIQDFLTGANPDKYLLRLTAQALGGRALAGEPTPGAVRDDRTREQRAIDTLLASWRRLMGDESRLI